MIEARHVSADGLDHAIVLRAVARVVPNAKVSEVRLLKGGLRHRTFLIHLESAADALVLKSFCNDASACKREAALLSMLRGSMPVPEVVDVKLESGSPIAPYVLLRFVKGISFRQLKRVGDLEAVQQAAHSVGQVLGQLSALTPSVTESVEPSSLHSRFLEEPAGGAVTDRTVHTRLGTPLQEATAELLSSWTERLFRLSGEFSVVHGDFNKRNVLVAPVAGVWLVTAVIDWEAAFLGTSLADVASFLRYEWVGRPTAEPAFSRGYLETGGRLPPDWIRLSRVLDLLPLTRLLSEERIPDDVVREVVDLVRATVSDCRPN